MPDCPSCFKSVHQRSARRRLRPVPPPALSGLPAGAMHDAVRFVGASAGHRHGLPWRWCSGHFGLAGCHMLLQTVGIPACSPGPLMNLVKAFGFHLQHRPDTPASAARRLDRPWRRVAGPGLRRCTARGLARHAGAVRRGGHLRSLEAAMLLGAAWGLDPGSIHWVYGTEASPTAAERSSGGASRASNRCYDGDEQDRLLEEDLEVVVTAGPHAIKPPKFGRARSAGTAGTAREHGRPGKSARTGLTVDWRLLRRGRRGRLVPRLMSFPGVPVGSAAPAGLTLARLVNSGARRRRNASCRCCSPTAGLLGAWRWCSARGSALRYWDVRDVFLPGSCCCARRACSPGDVARRAAGVGCLQDWRSGCWRLFGARTLARTTAARWRVGTFLFERPR